MSETLAISEIFNGIAEPLEEWGLSQWEAVIERSYQVKGYALRQIRDKRLYLESHFTFKDYLRERWDLSESYAYRLMSSSEAVEKNLPIGKEISTAKNEWQARNLLHPPRHEPREFINNPATWTRPYKYTPDAELTPSQREIRDNYKTEILRAAQEIKAEQAEERRTERIAKVVELAQASVDPLTNVGRFPLIYADPPWQYDFSVDDADQIENHYPTMNLEEICDLPVATAATDDAVLLLWTTSPKLEEAFAVISAWGFTYRTCAIWDKEWIGPGYYFRQRHELLLIATRGSLPVPLPSNRPDSIFAERRTKHSKKPELAYQLIERMYPELPKLELFARSAREGWRAWGNEAVKEVHA